MHNLFLRILMFTFLTIAIMVVAMSAIINNQIFSHFNQYIYMYHGPGMGPGMHNMAGNMAAMMGNPEIAFLTSLRRSLMVLAGVMLLVGAAVSYFLARSIANPLSHLSKAVKAVAEGNMDVTVAADRKDEVGQLAKTFNFMTSRLKTNNILRQRFLAGIAHELRTPLAILKANLEGIKDGVIDADQAQIVSLTEEVDRLTTMVEDLQQLSLLEAGQTHLEIAPVELNTLIQNIAGKIKPLITEKGLNFRMELSANPIYAVTDAARVNQMIYNLVINAIKYTPSGGHVVLRTSASQDRGLIDVSDTGVGIPQEDLPHIFDYFYRTDPSRSKSSGGTGLGLAIVKQLATALGGKVTVISTVSKGSTFTVELPLNTP
jgi:signal transduction histidine kinase